MTDADRLSRALTAALHSPDFALRFLSRVPAPERAEALRLWAAAPSGGSPQLARPSAAVKPGAPRSVAPAEPRPGLRKCGARDAVGPSHSIQGHATQSHDLALQLAAFARSIGRVS